MVEVSAIECSIVAKYGDIMIFVSSDEVAPFYAYSHDDDLICTEVPIGKRINAIIILDAFHIWFACNDGYIYFSDDGGKSVVVQEAGVVTNQHLRSITFINDLYGYAVGDKNFFLYTCNGGQIWQAGKGPQGAGDLQGVGAVQGTDIVLVCDSNGIVYRSVTRGLEWKIVLREVRPGHIWITDHRVGVFDDTHQFISENGGRTWRREKLPDWNDATQPLYSVSSLVNWCCGEE
jgi:photosystem II stability/assembly factor-like uncharacterized protein